jgi:Arc/MetJ-type ribon-helix-helix transcriptional regulator
VVRTQIYLTEKERDSLAILAQGRRKKQSELIREAIDAFIGQQQAGHKRAALEGLAGMWRERTDLPEFAALRAEWDRTGAP